MFRRRGTIASPSIKQPPKPKHYKPTFIDPLTQAILFSSYELSDSEGLFLTDLASSLTLTLHSNDGLHHFARWLFLSTYPTISSTKFTPPKSYPLIGFLERDMEYSQQYSLIPKFHFPFATSKIPFYIDSTLSIPSYIKHNVILSPNIYKSTAFDTILEDIQWQQQKESTPSSFFFQRRFQTFSTLVLAYLPIGFFLLRIWAHLESLRISIEELQHQYHLYLKHYPSHLLPQTISSSTQSLSSFSTTTTSIHDDHQLDISIGDDLKQLPKSRGRSAVISIASPNQGFQYQQQQLQSYLHLAELIIQLNIKLNFVLNEIYSMLCRNSMIVQLLDIPAIDFLQLYFDLHQPKSTSLSSSQTTSPSQTTPQSTTRPSIGINITIPQTTPSNDQYNNLSTPNNINSPSQRKMSFNLRPISAVSTASSDESPRNQSTPPKNKFDSPNSQDNTPSTTPQSTTIPHNASSRARNISETNRDGLHHNTNTMTPINENSRNDKISSQLTLESNSIEDSHVFALDDCESQSFDDLNNVPKKSNNNNNTNNNNPSKTTTTPPTHQIDDIEDELQSSLIDQVESFSTHSDSDNESSTNEILEYEHIVDHLHDHSNDLPPPPSIPEVFDIYYLALPTHPQQSQQPTSTSSTTNPLSILQQPPSYNEIENYINESKLPIFIDLTPMTEFTQILFSLQLETFSALMPLHQFWTLFQPNFIDAIHHSKVYEYLDINDHFYSLVRNSDPYFNSSSNQNNATVAYSLQISRMQQIQSINTKYFTTLVQLQKESNENKTLSRQASGTRLTPSNSQHVQSSHVITTHNVTNDNTTNNNPSLTTSQSTMKSTNNNSTSTRLTPQQYTHQLGTTPSSISQVSNLQFNTQPSHSSRPTSPKPPTLPLSREYSTPTHTPTQHSILSSSQHFNYNNMKHSNTDSQLDDVASSTIIDSSTSSTTTGQNNNTTTPNNTTNSNSDYQPIIANSQPLDPNRLTFQRRSKLDALDMAYWVSVELQFKTECLSYFFISAFFELNPTTALTHLLRQAPILNPTQNQSMNHSLKSTMTLSTTNSGNTNQSSLDEEAHNLGLFVRSREDFPCYKLEKYHIQWKPQSTSIINDNIYDITQQQLLKHQQQQQHQQLQKSSPQQRQQQLQLNPKQSPTLSSNSSSTTTPSNQKQSSNSKQYGLLTLNDEMLDIQLVIPSCNHDDPNDLGIFSF